MSEKKRRILVVSRSFYPEISPRSFRTTELVKELSRQGHEVTLFTLKDDSVHEPFAKEHGISIKTLGPLRWPVIRASSKYRPLWLAERTVEMGLKLLVEYPDLELMYRVKSAMKNESGYDLLISVAVPHTIHWGVAKARSAQHPIAKVWAADCGDPYMGFKMDRFNKPFWFKYPEKLFCRKADAITVPFEGAKDAYYQEFRHKMKVIPQGFSFEGIERNTTEGPMHENPVFGYAGGLLGGGRNPFPLLDYLAGYDKPYRFIIYTNNPKPVKPYLDRAKGNIEVRKPIPRTELLDELTNMDFLINLENESRTQMPSKLIDYYLTGRPVLSIGSSSFDPNIFNQFLEGDYSARYHYENVEQYRIENVCRRFIELCKT
mgnify:CR=1 FL=1